jgi:hypothetical protein
MAKIALPLTGACQCRAVAYCLHAAPLTLYCCHCTECQHQSASAFGMSCLVRPGDLEVDWSKLHIWARPTDSGGRLNCHFCGVCGSRLFHVSVTEPDTISIKAGSFDNRAWLQPVGHIWTKSAQPWFSLPAGTIQDAGDPGDMSRYIDRWRQVTKGWFGA